MDRKRATYLAEGDAPHGARDPDVSTQLDADTLALMDRERGWRSARLEAWSTTVNHEPRPVWTSQSSMLWMAVI